MPYRKICKFQSLSLFLIFPGNQEAIQILLSCVEKASTLQKKVDEKLGKFYQSIEVMSFFSKNNKGA